MTSWIQRGLNKPDEDAGNRVRKCSTFAFGDATVLNPIFQHIKPLDLGRLVEYEKRAGAVFHQVGICDRSHPGANGSVMDEKFEIVDIVLLEIFDIGESAEKSSQV